MVSHSEFPFEISTALAEVFGISRPTVYTYIKRYDSYDDPGLAELSKAPKRVANETDSRIEKRDY
ncbi:helix-turn-helix domain-containing protein [Spirochaeta cellobiosiphila]|uniref:helix-turn-helix domain-containing protein n=1 Tax=Spirochaeta cellobiosiphila TaxID=504483 RepID=UPI00040F32C0|nr:helix-turn-helix domain-containing protein [Spirochaeta cellobiosiphila]